MKNFGKINPNGESFNAIELKKKSSPLMLSFPHSGDFYPDDFRYSKKIPFETIDFPNDKFVDELWNESNNLEISTLKANFPRAYVDVNRHQHDIDRNMIENAEGWYARFLPSSTPSDSTLFWSKANERFIYDRKLSLEEAKNRIAKYFIPYHQTMTTMVERIRKQHGFVCIIDCHSMTRFDSQSIGGKERPEIDIGTRFNQSCDTRLSDYFATLFEKEGYQVGINSRFVGGEITLRYGWPEINQHIFQVEIRRDLYMNEETRKRNNRFAAMQSDCSKILKLFKKYVCDNELKN